MAKMCPRCNTPVADDAQSCINCGYSFGNTKKKKRSKLAVIMTIIAIIAIAVSVVEFLYITKLSSEKKAADDAIAIAQEQSEPIEIYYNAIATGDSSALVEITPGYELESYDPEDYDFEEQLDSMLEYKEEEFGKNYNVTYEFIVSREFSEDELDQLKTRLDDSYSELNYDTDRITDAASIVMEITETGDDAQSTHYEIMTIIKEDDVWKIR